MPLLLWAFMNALGQSRPGDKTMTKQYRVFFTDGTSTKLKETSKIGAKVWAEKREKKKSFMVKEV